MNFPSLNSFRILTSFKVFGLFLDRFVFHREFKLMCDYIDVSEKKEVAS